MSSYPAPVIVYSTGPSCVKCNATTRLLARLTVPFELRLLADFPDEAEKFRAEGHTSAPVVVAPDGETWSDFRPDRVADVAARVKFFS